MEGEEERELRSWAGALEGGRKEAAKYVVRAVEGFKAGEERA